MAAQKTPQAGRKFLGARLCALRMCRLIVRACSLLPRDRRPNQVCPIRPRDTYSVHARRPSSGPRSLWRRHLSRGISPLCGRAHGGQTAVARARRIVRGVDHMPGVFPGCAAAGLPLRALAGRPPVGTISGQSCTSGCWWWLRCCWLWVRPDLSSAAGHPLAAIFRAPTLTIGLPFLLLSSTSPLLQLWLARKAHSGVPWKLFALSNAGSLLALVLYPTSIEPHLSLSRPADGLDLWLRPLRGAVRAHCLARALAGAQTTSPAQANVPNTTISSAPATVVSASGRRRDAVVRGHQPSEPEHRRDSAAVGAAPGRLSAHLHHRL